MMFLTGFFMEKSGYLFEKNFRRVDLVLKIQNVLPSLIMETNCSKNIVEISILHTQTIIRMKRIV